MTRLQVWGGAGEHGRSCYVITGTNQSLMLDCGVKKSLDDSYPLIEKEQIPGLNAVLLSHAHEDHSMSIPLLYRYGYTGDIWTTRETAGQLERYFFSWRKYAASRGQKLPYDEEHIVSIRYRYLEDYGAPGQWIQLKDNLQVLWGRSGHLLGSVWFQVAIEGNSLFFSGDYSRESLLLEADIPAPLASMPNTQIMDKLDLSLLDNAYGMDCESQQVKLEQLQAATEAILNRGGHVLLPVPMLGRSQDLLIWAAELWPQHTIIAEKEIWLGLQELSQSTKWLTTDAEARIQRVVQGNHVVVPSDDQERNLYLDGTRPCIVITNDGMMDSERARWYYERLSKEERNGIILSGHLAKESFASRLLEKSTQSSPGCTVQHIRYKVHQGLQDVRNMLREVPSRHTVLVHAPKAETDQVVETLSHEGKSGLYSLMPGAVLDF